MFQRQRPRLDLLHVVNDGSVIHRISPWGGEFGTFWYEISSGTVQTEQATTDLIALMNGRSPWDDFISIYKRTIK